MTREAELDRVIDMEGESGACNDGWCSCHQSARDARSEYESRKEYVVQIADLYDDDVRDAITLTAFGEHDIRQQVREFHPGWYVRGWDEVTA